MEGVVRGYNWMEPLLRTRRLSPHLLRTMCVLRSSLDAVPREQWYPSCKRVYARLTHELKRLGDDVTEMDASLIALTSDSSSAAGEEGEVESVEEQEQLVVSLNYTDYWRRGREELERMAGMKKITVVEGEEEDGGGGSHQGDDLDQSIWRCIHGAPTKEEDKDQQEESSLPPMEERLTAAFALLNQTSEEVNGKAAEGVDAVPPIGRTHPRYFEMVSIMKKKKFSFLFQSNSYDFPNMSSTFIFIFFFWWLTLTNALILLLLFFYSTVSEFFKHIFFFSQRSVVLVVLPWRTDVMDWSVVGCFKRIKRLTR